jgi:hypothetical protein
MTMENNEHKEPNQQLHNLVLKSLEFKPPLLIASVSNCTFWDEWLSETESKLKEIGYNKYNQNLKGEDFCYWKTFMNDQDRIYQIGILFYDYRKFGVQGIGVMYECMLLGYDRIDMSVSKNIDLPEFEKMSETFYRAMSQYLP